jgi:glutaredoxin
MQTNLASGTTKHVVCLLAACLLGGLCQAQTIYRHVGPDGRVFYSDQPPAGNLRSPASGSGQGSAGNSQGEPAGAALPYALRQTSARFPVTLYSSAECVPCREARSMLQKRGIPFAERTIQSNEDAAALQRLGGGNVLPQLTVGRQRLQGFQAQEWSLLLDAAGYPAQSVLPAGYRQAPAITLTPSNAAPLTSGAAAASGQANEAGEPSPSPMPTYAPPNAPNPNNPAGIQF